MNMPYKELLKEKNFSYLLIGRLLRRSALSLASMEIIWLTMELTNNSPLYLSLMVMAETLPFIVIGVYGGVKADIWNKKQVMVVSDVATAVFLIIIPVLYSFESINYILLMILVVGVTICNCFSEPCFRSILPELLTNKRMQEGNALLDSVQRGANILVPLSLGLVLKITTQIHLFTLAFILILGAGIFHLLINNNPSSVVDKTNGKESAKNDFKLTLQFLKKNKSISFIMLIQGISIMINTGLWRVGLPIYLENNLGKDIASFGYITGVLGAAAFATSILLGVFKRIKPILIFNIGNILWGIGLVTIGVTSSINVIYVATILVGMGQACEGLASTVIFQNQVPKYMLGKVFSISSSLNYTSDTVSLGLVSTILTLFTTATVFFGGGLIIVLTGVIGTLSLKERYKKIKKESLDESLG
jgi:DHA3 family macrolide efflux protein-like MFS transporter